MNGPFPHLAQRLYNTPLAIHPRKAEIVAAALAERLGIMRILRADGSPLMPMAFDDDDDWFFRERPSREDKGFDLVAGVAVIPVVGTLVQKLGTVRPYSGMTGYDGIRSAFFAAQEDTQIKAIALDIDSPGGEAAGLFDLVDAMAEARGAKPVWAILSESAYSAAYALATVADRILVPRTGGTGSIGIITMHVDFSRALNEVGITVRVIRFGEQKMRNNELEPLTDDALARVQADVDTMGELFVDTVARNRGIAASKVRATEAGTFLGAAGVTAGLADAVMAPDQAFAELLGRI
jgi:capsid assembly protease